MATATGGLPPMTPAGLASWRDRLGISDAEAARRLGTPYMTFRDYLPGGRRRQDRLPGWLPILCAYVETYGPISTIDAPKPARPERASQPHQKDHGR